MPSKRKPPRLYLVQYRDRPARWVIRDGSKTRGTGCRESEREKAAIALAEYIADKYEPQRSVHSTDQIWIAEVLAYYAENRAPDTARPEHEAYCIEQLLDFWGNLKLAEIRAKSCRAYVAERVAGGNSDQTARRHLETLRAAVNFYHGEFALHAVPKITLPRRSASKERWLTRDEAAHLLWTVWRTPRWKHLARFILIGIYTGTRTQAILNLRWKSNVLGGHIDLDHEIIYRRSRTARQTRKRQTPIKIHRRLLAHLKRWKTQDDLRTNSNATPPVVHFYGKKINKLRNSWPSARIAAGLDQKDDLGRYETTPHSLRHTAATWMMQAGVDPWEVCGYLAMTLETLQEVYGHHHPDFQNEAAMFSKPKGRNRNVTASRESKQNRR